MATKRSRRSSSWTNSSRSSASFLADVLEQGRRYDPDAEYIRRWLPELDGLPAAACHAPWQLSESQQDCYGVHLGTTYPEPMVDVEAVYARL